MATVGSMAVVLTASATDFERTMGRAARAVKSTEKEFMRSARQMESVGRRWTTGVTAPIMAGLAIVTKAAVDWEDAFAGVSKSMDGTAGQMLELDESLKDLAERVPLAHREIATIAESAGQLGIQTDNVIEFTETMAKVGATTTMSAEAAGTGFAQIDNIMQTGQKSFERYGSTALALGNNLATTEQKVVDFSLNIAGAGKIAGLSEAQVMAIGGAFGSVGIEAEAGGTAVSKVLIGMTEAVSTGNKNLKMFAATAGMSTAEFSAAWKEDAGKAFTRFVEGLGYSGNQAFGILKNLGLSDQRLIRGFLSVAGAGDLLSKSMRIGSKAWEENTYLSEKAAKRFKTVAARLKMLRNRAYNAAIAFGGAFAPLLEMAMTKAEKLVGVLKNMGEGFAKLPKPIRVITGNILLLFAAIGPANLMFALLNRTIAGALGFYSSLTGFIGNAAFAFQSWKVGAATLGESLVYLAGGPVKMTILAIGALITIAILLAANWDKVKVWAQAAWGAISATVLYSASLIVRGISYIYRVIAVFIPAMRGMATSVTGVANGLKNSAGAALASAKSTISAAKAADQAAKAQKKVSEEGKKAADSQNGLGKAMKDASKSAGKNLQSFDEVHELQEDMGSSTPDIEMPDIEIPDIAMGGIGDIASNIGDTLSKAAENASKAWDKLKDSMEPVNKAVQWIKDNWPTIGPIIEDLAGLIALVLTAKFIKLGLEATIAGAKMVAAWVSSKAEAIASVAVHVAQMAIAGAKWVWLGIQATISAAKVAAAWIASMGPIGWVIAAVAAVVTAIILNWDEIKEATIRIWTAISDWVVGAWGWIKETAVKIWDSIKAFFAEWWDLLLAVFTGPIGILVYLIVNNWDKIKETTETVWNAVSEWLGTLWDGIVSLATTTWGRLASIVSAAWEATETITITVWEAIKEFLFGLWDGIALVATTVWDWLKDIISTAWEATKTITIMVWESIRDFLVGLWDGVAEAAITAWDSISEFIKNTWNTIRDNTVNAWNAIKDFLFGLWNGIASLASDTWNNFTKIISDATSKSTGAIYDFASNIVSKLKNMSTNAINAVKDMASGIAKWISDAVSKGTKSIFSFASDIVSKIKNMSTNTINAVKDMTNGIVKWLKDLPKRTLSTVKSWADSVTSSVKNMYMKIVGGSIVPDLVMESTDWFKRWEKDSKSIVTDMSHGVVDGFFDMSDTSLATMTVFGRGLQSVSQNITSGMQGVFNQTFSGIIKGSMAMSDAFQSVMTGMGDVAKQVLVQQLSQVVTNSLATMGSWVLGVVASSAKVVGALISQAYATLVAFYAWSGPFAPVLAGGTIAAAIAAIGSVAAKATNAFKGVVGLATGGIVTGPTFAQLGEGGRKEAVIPLERDNVIADSVGQAVYQAMVTATRVGQASGSSNDGDREIVLSIDGAKFAQAVLPVLIREGQRQDMQFVVRPQGV